MSPHIPGCDGARGAGVVASALRTTAMAADVSGAGLMLVGDGTPQAIGGSDADGQRLERAQVTIGSGPAFRCMVSGRPVAVRDLPSGYPDGHPELAPYTAPVHAVLSVPIRVDEVVAGSLDLYDHEPHAWSHAQVAAGRELADVLAGVLCLLATGRESDTVPGVRPGTAR